MAGTRHRRATGAPRAPARLPGLFRRRHPAQRPRSRRRAASLRRRRDDGQCGRHRARGRSGARRPPRSSHRKPRPRPRPCPPAGSARRGDRDPRNRRGQHPAQPACAVAHRYRAPCPRRAARRYPPPGRCADPGSGRRTALIAVGCGPPHLRHGTGSTPSSGVVTVSHWPISA